MSLPPVGPWMMWVGIGLPAYLFLCFGIGKTIAVGMGSDEPSALQQAQDAYEAAVRRGDTRGMSLAYQALRTAKNAQLAAEISHRAPASWRGR